MKNQESNHPGIGSVNGNAIGHNNSVYLSPIVSQNTNSNHSNHSQNLGSSNSQLNSQNHPSHTITAQGLPPNPKWNRRRSLQPTTLEFQLSPTSNRISTPLQKRISHIRTTSLPPKPGLLNPPSRRHSTTSVDGTLPHNSVNGISLTLSQTSHQTPPQAIPTIGNEKTVSNHPIQGQVNTGNTINNSTNNPSSSLLTHSGNVNTISYNTNVQNNSNLHGQNNQHNTQHNAQHNVQHGNIHQFHSNTVHSFSLNNVNHASTISNSGRGLAITGYSYQKTKNTQNLHQVQLQKILNSANKRPGTPVRQIISENVGKIDQLDLNDMTESASIETVNLFDDDGFDSLSFLSDTDEILTIMSMESAEPEPMITDGRVLKQVHLQNLSLNANPLTLKKGVKQQNTLASNRQRIFKNRTFKGPLQENITPSKLLIQGISKQYSQPESKSNYLNTSNEEEIIEDNETQANGGVDDDSGETNDTGDSDTDSFFVSYSSSIQTEKLDHNPNESIEDYTRNSEDYGDSQNETQSESFEHLEDLYIYFGYLPTTYKDAKSIIEKHDSYQDLVRPLLSPLASGHH